MDLFQILWRILAKRRREAEQRKMANFDM